MTRAQTLWVCNVAISISALHASMTTGTTGVYPVVATLVLFSMVGLYFSTPKSGAKEK